MEILIALVILVLWVVLMRAIGAWMLRINEVIALLKSIDNRLSKQEKSNFD